MNGSDIETLSSLLKDAFQVNIKKRSECEAVKTLRETKPFLADKICDESIDEEDIKMFVEMMLGKIRMISENRETMESATREVSSAVIGKYNPDAEKYKKEEPREGDNKRKRV